MMINDDITKNNDAIGWYKVHEEGKAVIDMLIILIEHIDEKESKNTIINDIISNSTKYVLNEAIKIIQACYTE